MNLLSKKLLLSGVVLSVLLCSSLVPLAKAASMWSQTYGESGTDCAHSLVATSDGGYAIAGSTSSSGAGQDDFWLVKIDESGNVEWNQTYGGESFDYAYSLAATSDGGYALAGGDLLVKTDAFGNMQWSKTYEQGSVHSLIAMSDGGYILAGAWNYSGDCDFWLVKTDSTGVMEWNRKYGGPANDYACSVVAASSGGYAIAGATNGDFWLVKTDALGNMEWSRTYGGEGAEATSCLVEAPDGGYVIAGSGPSSDHKSFDFWLVKTDEFGFSSRSALWLPSLILLLTGASLVVASILSILIKRRKLRKR